MFGGIIGRPEIGIGGLGAVLGVLAKLIPSIIQIIGAKLETFAKALEGFFKALGLIEADEQVEEIGDKALQAEGDDLHPVKVEDFDSHEKYLATIKERESDPEASALIPQDEKFQKGIELLLGLAIEKYGKSMGDFGELILSNLEPYSNPDRMTALGDLASKDKDKFTEVVDFLNNKIKDSNRSDSAFDTLVNIEKNISPEAPEPEIWKTVSEMKHQ